MVHNIIVHIVDISDCLIKKFFFLSGQIESVYFEGILHVKTCGGHRWKPEMTASTNGVSCGCVNNFYYRGSKIMSHIYNGLIWSVMEFL